MVGLGGTELMVVEAWEKSDGKVLLVLVCCRFASCGW
jgi:hypothetical protein